MPARSGRRTLTPSSSNTFETENPARDSARASRASELTERLSTCVDLDDVRGAKAKVEAAVRATEAAMQLADQPRHHQYIHHLLVWEGAPKHAPKNSRRSNGEDGEDGEDEDVKNQRFQAGLEDLADLEAETAVDEQKAGGKAGWIARAPHATVRDKAHGATRHNVAEHARRLDTTILGTQHARTHYVSVRILFTNQATDVNGSDVLTLAHSVALRVLAGGSNVQVRPLEEIFGESEGVVADVLQPGQYLVVVTILRFGLNAFSIISRWLQRPDRNSGACVAPLHSLTAPRRAHRGAVVGVLSVCA